MPVLQVQHHRLAASGTASTPDTREIDLDCVGDAGRMTAALHCSDGCTAVGYAVEGAAGEMRLIGWLPRRQFRRLRQLLARGGPVSLRFALRDRGARCGYLAWFGLDGPGGGAFSADARPVPERAHGDMPRGPVPSRYAMPL